MPQISEPDRFMTLEIEIAVTFPVIALHGSIANGMSWNFRQCVATAKFRMLKTAPHLCPMSLRTDTCTVQAFLDEHREALIAVHGPTEARAMLRAVFQDRLALAFPESEPERLLTPEELASLQEPLERLRAGGPLQYVLGHVDFHGLRIAVDPRVLIPRPETEELVDRIIRSSAQPPATIVDIGTGSGCIALALKKAFPQAKVVGVDISPSALELARANAQANALEVEWTACDALGPELAPLLKKVRSSGGMHVVSNPPYVPFSDKASMQDQVLRHEPHLALFVEDADPQLFYRAISAASASAMGQGDVLWFEVHYRHAHDTMAVVKAAGFEEAKLIKDLSGNPRFIRAQR
jgi:release factor glutamine methyltransferase